MCPAREDGAQAFGRVCVIRETEPESSPSPEPMGRPRGHHRAPSLAAGFPSNEQLSDLEPHILSHRLLFLPEITPLTLNPS